ncbi:MAG: hypothetical protein H6558_17050 [Lewinellaceae bacterium]|nr:hypothetical protein [Lewinellaceae bacterium]MCB9286606.1 hypothetical protein [Lewinellaceae bacterium]
MAYTTISELEGFDGTDRIENGPGFFKEGHTFFYAEDIQLVLAQGDTNTKLSQLRILNIVFKRNDGSGNHNRHEVTGLALAKSEIQTDAEDRILNEDWYDNVALAWPPYYIRGSVQNLEDQENEGFIGDLFEGSPEYVPGDTRPPLKKNVED